MDVLLSLRQRLAAVIYLNIVLLFQILFVWLAVERVIIGLGMMALVAAVGLAPLEPVRVQTSWRRAALGGLLSAAVPLGVSLASVGSVHRIRVLEAGIMAFLAFAIWTSPLWRCKAPSLIVRYGTVVLIAAALLIPFGNLVSGLLVPKLMDVATMTVDAVHLLWAGQNPYAANFDRVGVLYAARFDAIAAASPAYAAFGGYKYGPLILLYYAPFVLAAGEPGVLFANVVAYAVCAFLVVRLCRDIVGGHTTLALILFLAAPAVANHTLALGVHDILCAVMICLAFLTHRRSALLTGFILGAGLSMKLLPGALAVAVLIPSVRRDMVRYAAGIALGLLPMPPFFLWDPPAFIKNLLIFNFIRFPDQSTWRYHAPGWAGLVASIASVVAILASSFWCAWTPARPAQRLYCYTLLVLFILMMAPANHDNYAPWWMPMAAVLVAAAGRCASAEGTDTPRPMAVGGRWRSTG